MSLEMTKEELERVVANAIQTLLLSEHMGDAHEATLALALAIGGPGLGDAVRRYVDGERDALVGDTRFGILGRRRR